MMSACTANSQYVPMVSRLYYDRVRLAATVDYSLQVLYERCTAEKKA